MNKSFIVLIFSFLGLSIFAQDPQEIIQKMDAQLRGLSSLAELEIQIIRPKWERTIGIKAWTKGTDYSMTMITSPKRDKGTVFLKRGKEMWNWMPSIERTIKLPPSMMAQSWMGTDFTNDDLVNQSSVVTDYEYKLLGSEDVNGVDCHNIQLIPKPDAPVVWGKILFWVEKEDYIQMKVEFYDEDDFLVNTMIGSNIKKFGSKRLVSEYQMIPEENPEHKTLMRYKDLQFDVKIKDAFFTTNNMKRLK